MSIKVRLSDAFGRILGASWASPIRTALSGTGGGDYHSPVSFTATVGTNGKITLSGIAPTVTDSSQFRGARAYDARGALVGEWYPCDANPFLYDATEAALVIGGADLNGVAFVDVWLNAEHRAYSSTEDAYQDYSVNPPWSRIQRGTNTATAQGDGTTPYYYDVSGYKHWGVQIADTPGAAGDQTYTVWASWEDTAVITAATATYLDVTQPWFGFASVTSAQITANPYAGILQVNTPLTCRFIRLQVVRANDGAATDGAWTIYGRSNY